MPWAPQHRAAHRYRRQPGLLRRSGGENLVEDGLSLVLVGLLCERELGDEDLTGLGQHALLASGEATVLVTTPQVAHDLGDLDDIAGRELLEVISATSAIPSPNPIYSKWPRP